MKPLGTTLVALLLAAALAPAATAAKRQRPDAVPAAFEVAAPNAIQVLNDYVTPAHTYASERAVVHYVTLGVSAPPLNDDDADGVPDYVERVGAAADTALTYYERRGFAGILADAGGPDGRPDIYISRFAAGYFGVAFPAADAEGGGFLAVSNWLDPSPTASLGSLDGTVAHELFHLVQFSYFRPTIDPPLDAWVLEGTAAAMETRVFPEVEDIVSSLQLRHWFAAPETSMTAQSYGAQLLWRYLDVRRPQLRPASLAALGRRPGREAATLAATYEQVAHRPFARTFGEYAAWVAGAYGDTLEHLPMLHRVRTASVGPLAIHFVRMPRSTRSVTVRFAHGHGEAVLSYAVASPRAGEPPVERRLAARTVGGALTFRVPAGLRASDRYQRPTLVVANGGVRGAVVYRVSAGLPRAASRARARSTVTRYSRRSASSSARRR